MNQPFPSAWQDTSDNSFEHKVDIPREFGPLLDAYALDSHHRIELWTFAIVVLMIDDEQVRVIGTRELADTQWLVLEMQDGEQFEIIHPQLTLADEMELFRGVRKIMAGGEAS